MISKSNIRKTLEVTLSLTVIAGLLAAAGCGKGSSSSNTSAGVPTAAIQIVVASGGKYGAGAAVTIHDAQGNTLGTGTTNSSGQASVAIPTSYKGPLVVDAGATGSYYDPKASSVSPVTTTLHAVTANESPLVIGVTPLTEISSAMLLDALGKVSIQNVSGVNSSTSLTSASAVQAIAAINQAIGAMFGVSDPLKPPKAAAAGKPAEDTYGATLANLAFLAPAGKTTMDVTKDLRDDIKDGNWDGNKTTASGVVAAITPSATAFTAAITTAATQAVAASAVAVAAVAPNPQSNVVAAVTVQQTAVTAQVAAANNLIALGTTAGVRSWYTPWTQGIGLPLGGMTMTSAYGTIDSLTTAGANVWNMSHSFKEWVNGLWATVAATGTGAGTATDQGYVLTASGWVVEGAQTTTIAQNNDGSLSITIPGNSRTLSNLMEVNLLNTPISVLQASGVWAATSAVYPAGSLAYSADQVQNQDYYWIGGMHHNKMHDSAGAYLTAMPGGPVQFCDQGTVFAPIVPTPTLATADNFTVYFGMGCGAAAQTAAKATVAAGTVNISQDPLHPGVVAIITVSAANPTLAWLNDTIFSVVNGAMRSGYLTRAGTVTPAMQIGMNKVAIDADLAASGLSPMESATLATNLPANIVINPISFTALQTALTAAAGSAVPVTTTWTQPAGTVVTQTWADLSCPNGNATVSSGPLAPTATSAVIMAGAGNGCNGATAVNTGMTYTVNGGTPLFIAKPY